jgi:ABC-type transport system substrate-binding protein
LVLTKAPGSKASLAGVRFVEYADRQGALAGMQRGEVDWAAVPDGQSVDPSTLGQGVQVEPGMASAERFFAFNLAKPSLSQASFRQAIVKAIDRGAIAKDILGSDQPLGGVVPPSLPGGSADACGSMCAHDPDGAKALLQPPAGSPGSVFVAPLEVDAYSSPSSDSGAQQKMVDAIVKDVSAVGISATAVIKPFAEYRSFAATSPDRQLFSYGWVGLSPDPDAFVAPLFLSASPDNVTGFRDAFVDDAIVKARAIADHDQRMQAYQAVETQIMQSVPIVPLAVLDSSVVVSKNVGNYHARFDGTFDAEALTVSS